MATIEEIRAKVRNGPSQSARGADSSPQGASQGASAIEQVRQQVLAGASSDQRMNAATAAGRQYAETMAREQEAARERAAMEQRQAESIAQVDSVNPYTVQKLGAAPQASNVRPGDRQTEPGMYAAALNQLQSARQAQREQPAISETLRATKAAQLGLPETRPSQSPRAATALPASGASQGVQQVSGQPRTSLDALIDETEKLQDIVDRYERSGIYDEKYELAKQFLDQYQGEIDRSRASIEKSGAGTKASTARQDRARERTQQLLAMDTEAERRKQRGSDAMRDQMDALRGILDRYDQAGVKDAKYDLIKWNLEEQEKEYQRQFGDMADVRDIEEAEKLQRLRELESVQGAQDYWGKSQYDPAFGSESSWSSLRNQYDIEGDLLYDYINDRNGVRTKATVNRLQGEHGGLDLEYLGQMSADERRVYSYLYATQGKETAEEYLELLSSDLNARNMEEITSWWRDYAGQDKLHGAIASAASVAMSPLRGASYVGQIADYLGDGTIDQNAGYNRYSQIPSAIREEVSHEVAGKWGEAGSFLYETGMSMLDFITNALITGSFTGGGAVEEALTLGIMGTGAAADATIAAKERGMSDAQAMALGTIAGVAEVMTEKISLETLLNKTNLDRRLIGYLFKNTLAEGSEEVGSDFINLFADILTAKDESEWRQSVKRYQSMGYDESQAFWAAFTDQAKTMGKDFLGGAISGLLMAGGSVSIDKAAAKIQQQRVDQLRQTLSDLAESQERAERERDRLLKQAQTLETDGADAAQIIDETGWIRDLDGNWWMPAVGYEETLRTPEGARIESESEEDEEYPSQAAEAASSPQGASQEGADFITEEIRTVDPDFDELTDEQKREYRTYQEQALREAQAMTEAGADPAYVYAQTGWTQGAAGEWVKSLEETASATEEGHLISQPEADSFPSRGSQETNPSQSPQAATALPASGESQGMMNNAEGAVSDEVLLHESGERDDGQSTGGQAGQLDESAGAAENTGRTERTGRGNREIVDRRKAAEGSEARSTRDYGVTDGLTSKTLREIPANTDAELQGQKDLCDALGIPVTFTDQRLQVRNRTNGRVQNADAIYTGSRIVVCATLPDTSVTALTGHEIYHALDDANGDRMTTEIWNALVNQYGQEQMNELLRKAITTYKGIYGTEEEDLVKYKAEVIADLYGGLDRRGMGYTPEMQQFVQQAADDPRWETPGESRSRRSGQQMFSAAQKEEEPQQRFSMSEPVEETRTLVAMHNLTADNLQDTLRLGGFPAPSIAIIRAEQGHTNYGPYSVVFPRSTVDPQANRKNRVYASDAWTPTATNARVEYQVNQRAAAQIEERIEELSGQIAGGAYQTGSILRSMGIDDATEWNAERIAERMADKEAVRAAYLADQGIPFEPIYRDKEFNRYGNDRLAEFEERVGPARLAQIESLFLQGMSMEEALGPDADVIRQIIRGYYEDLNEPMIRRQAERRGWTEEETEEQRRRRNDRSMEGVDDYRIEQFARNAWEYYEDGGRTKDELDRLATSNRLEEAAPRKAVQEWARAQIEGLLGEAGIRNGRDTFTASGNRRSFSALHYPLTAENIVRAMYENTEGSRGQNAFGVSARTMASVASPEFRNVDQMHASESRLQRVSEEEYSAKLRELDEQISAFERSVRANNEAHSDNSFEEGEIIGTVLMDNAGKTSAEQIQRGFAREDYQLTPEQAQAALDIYQAAAELPTEYFEAKPERVVGFDEVAAVIAPDNAPADLIADMEGRGMNVLQYETGNEADRLEKLNSLPDVRFSMAQEEDPSQAAEAASSPQGASQGAAAQEGRIATPPEAARNDSEGIDTGEQVKAAAEAMTIARLEQRLKTDRKQQEQYDYLRSTGEMTSALEKRAEIHAQHTAIRQQVLTAKRFGGEGSHGARVDVAISVGTKKDLRELQKQLEQQRGALELLEKSDENKRKKKELTTEIERLKKEISNRNRSERAEKRRQRQETADKVRAIESRTTLRDQLLRDFSVAQDRRGEIGGLIDEFAQKVERKGSIDRADRTELFNALLDSGAVRVIEDEYANEIRQELKGTRIYVPEDLRAEWKGDYDEFRKRAWGAGLTLTSNPSDSGWDTLTEELAEQFGGVFDATETDGKIALETLLNVMESGRPSSMSWREYLNLQAGGEERGVQSALKAMGDNLDAALNQFAGAAQMEINLKADSIMQEAREALALEERAARARESRELRELQAQTMAEMKRLNRLRGKTDNATRAEIDRVIGSIDLLARRLSPEGLENLQALADAYQAQKDEQGHNFIPNDYVEKRIARLGMKHVDDMDASELRELGRVVSGMVTSIQNARQMLGEEQGRQISDMAEQWRDEIKNWAGMSGGVLSKLLKAEQIRPSTFLKMISADGEVGNRLVRMLEQGELKQLDFLRRGTQHFDKFLSDPEVKKWLKTASGKNAQVLEYAVPVSVDKDGVIQTKKIRITPMMRVSLAMDAENYDNLRHIAEGGIRIPDMDLYKKGHPARALSAGEIVKIQPEGVRTIARDLTPMEQQFKTLLQQYMDGMSKEAINETSMALDGFERAMEAHYWPIRTDKDFIKGDPETVKFDSTVENTGSISNERQHAGNPIKLYDANDMLAWHMDQTARYYGMAIPVHNLNSVYQYTFHNVNGEPEQWATSIQDVLDRKSQGVAKNYIDNLLKDIQNQPESESSIFAQMSAALRGKLAGSTLSLNPSVMAAQFASYPAALQTFDAKSMRQGLNLLHTVDDKLIQKYSPVLWYRAEGNISDATNQDTGFKLPRWADGIRAVDKFAVKRLWAAAEAWVENNTDLKRPTEGTDPAAADQFYQRVAEKFNRAVFDTQPNYSTLQRTQIQRQGNEFTKLLTLYKTVPLQYYNMMLEADSKLKAAQKRAKAAGATEADQAALKEAQSYFARTHVGLLASNLLYVAIKVGLFNALIRKRDDLKNDEGETTAGSIASGLGWALAETYAGSIIGSDLLIEMARHFVDGSKRYGRNLSVLDTVNDGLKLIERTGDQLKNLIAGKSSLADGLDEIHDAAMTIATFTGVPAENAEKWLLVAAKWIAPKWAYRYEDIFDEIEKSDIKGEAGKELRSKIEVLMSNRTDDLQDETVDELTRLWAAGCGNVLPTALPDSFTVNGEDVELSAKKQRIYRDAWSEAVTENLQDLMDTEAYQDADDAGRQKLIKKLYEYGNEKAKAAVVNYEPDRWVRTVDETGMSPADYIALSTWLGGMEKTEEETTAEIKRQAILDSDLTPEQQGQIFYTALADKDQQAWIDERVEAGDSLADVAEALMRYMNANGTAEKLQVIRDSGLNEDNKLALYEKITDKQGDRIETFRQAKLDLDDYLEIAQKYSEINAGKGSATEKSNELALWLDRKGYTALQKQTVKDELNFYSMVKAGSEKYDALTGAGLSADNAYKVTGLVSELKPEAGKQQVSDVQKLEAIGNSGLSQKDQLAAAKVYADDSTDQKLDVLSGYDVTVAQYAEFKKLYAAYCEDHKGETGGKQKAASEAAMEVIGSAAATPSGREAAAALWQTADKSWKAKNNPFDEAVGERVYAELLG